MKEYKRPQLMISFFEEENICTQASGIQGQSVSNEEFAQWESNNSGKIMNVDYKNINWVI